MKESTKLQWNGDVNLADGSLQKQYEEYKNRLEKAKVIALNRQVADKELEEVLLDIGEDLEFLHSGNTPVYYPYIDSYYILFRVNCI